MTERLRRFAQRLCSLEVWVVAGAVGASIVSARLLPAAVGVGAAFWPVRWLAGKRLTRRTPADWAILLLIAMTPVTLWATALPEKTLPQVLRLLSGILLFYAIANWANSPARVRLLVAGVVSAGALMALFATVSVRWATAKLPFIPPEVYSRFSLQVADTANPNVMAGNLVILLPIALALLVFAWGKMSWGERILAVAATLLATGIIGLAQSRGAWMALGAVVGLMVLLRWRWGWLALALAGAAGGYAAYRFGMGRVLELAVSSATLGGLSGRLEVWSRAIYMIQDFPFTGVGMGSFMDVADLIYPFFLYGPGSVEHAHNIFLQIAVDLGIPGLIGWLAAFVTITAMAWQMYRKGRKTGEGWAAALGAGLLCSQAALAVHGLTDAVTWGMVRPAPLVWALWGLAAAGWYTTHSERLVSEE